MPREETSDVERGNRKCQAEMEKWSAATERRDADRWRRQPPIDMKRVAKAHPFFRFNDRPDKDQTVPFSHTEWNQEKQR